MEAIREQDLVRKPIIKWGRNKHSLIEIAETHKLPLILQCATESSSSRLDDHNFDFKQPLMVFKKRKVKKVRAHSLGYHPVTHTTSLVGDPLLIPEDYTGWFACVSPTPGNDSSCMTPVYDNVEELAVSKTSKFLIGGSAPINGLQIVNTNGENGFHQRQCWPGDVLKKCKSYTAQTKKKIGFLRKSKIVEEKFLKCSDEHDRMLLLPYKMDGTFYQVNTDSPDTENGLLRIRSVIQKKQLPCVVKLVFGKPPSSPCAFTGHLQLDFVLEETSLIGSTVFNLKNIMFEFSIDSPVQFYVADEQNALRSSLGYKNALSLCSEQADLFVRNIKVTYNLNDDNRCQQRLKPSRQCFSPQIQSSVHNITPHESPVRYSSLHTEVSSQTLHPPPLPLKHGSSWADPTILYNAPTPPTCPGSNSASGMQKKKDYVDMNSFDPRHFPPPVACNSSGTSSSGSNQSLPHPNHKLSNEKQDDKRDENLRVIPDWNSGDKKFPHGSPQRETSEYITSDDRVVDDVFIELSRKRLASLPRETLERTFLEGENEKEEILQNMPVYENLKKIRELVLDAENENRARDSFDSTTSLTNLSHSESDTASLSSRHSSTGSMQTTGQSNMPDTSPRAIKLNNSVVRFCLDSRDSGIQDSYDDLGSMDVIELARRLKNMGVKNATQKYLVDNSIDGCILSSMYDTDNTLEEHLPVNDVSVIDRTKIIMFIQNMN